MNQKRTFRRTSIISGFLLGCLVGLWLSRTIAVTIGLPVTIALTALLLIFDKRTVHTLVLACLLGFSVGLWRGNSVQSQITGYQSLFGRKVQLQGRVLDDPVYDSQGRLDFRVGSIRIDSQQLPGQVRVKGFINGLMRGDLVAVNGKLGDGFGNYQAAIYFASTELITRSDNPIETVRSEFFSAVYSVLPEPHASLGLGFLVGLRSALPQDLDDQLRVAGLTHIVVASGYNLTILVRLSRRLFAKRSKYQALMTSLGLILLFLAVTGASPSMVRASVVTVLSLVAWYYGRHFQPVVIILLGAVLTAGFNPLFIWYDMGWWLSFLAFSGVLIAAPLITRRLYGDKTPPLLIQIALETMSAQLLVTPLILATFGEISLVALFANVAVVPLIPFAMATTFVAGVASVTLSAGFAGWLGLPAQLVLGYIISATKLFAAPSWAQREITVTTTAMVALYAGILLVGYWWYKKSKLSLHQLPSIVE
jgi:competence protein ComEC